MHYHRPVEMYKIFSIVLILLIPVGLSAQKDITRGGYGDMLYPYMHEYDQILVYKIGVDYCPSSSSPELNAGQVLEIIRKIDHISRGMPKMVYLVGWQYRGHDTGYPSFNQVNDALKNPGDKSAQESLRWLIKQGPKYNTVVSLHVNFSDVYLDDNPLGPVYKNRDIIVRWGNGDYHEGYTWCDHMAYRASNYRNWHQGTFQNDQINPLIELIPELLESGSLHPDAWYNTPDPYYGITAEEDCAAMREMTVWMRQKYNIDLTTEFDRRRPEGIDFVLFHPLLWHYEWDERTPPDPMQIPSYFQTGANAKTWSSGSETVQSKFFGEIGDYEGKIMLDPVNMAGVAKEFVTRTLPWYFLNRKLRVSFDGNIARFTDDVTSTYDGKYIIKSGDSFIQEGDDVFIPALWKTHNEIMAYSASGYKNRKWQLPGTWENIRQADIYKITLEGYQLKQKNVRLKSRSIELSLDPDESVFMIPAGTDPDDITPSSPSGEVEFAGLDNSTQGNWIRKYGSEGWSIVGAGENIPAYVSVKFINGADRIWTSASKDIEALEQPSGDLRIASQRYAGLHEIIEFDFKDKNTHLVSFYLLDWERSGRWTVVDAIDANTRKRMDTQNVTNFGGGVYLTYKCRGKIQFRITNVYSDRYTRSKDAGFSAIFFDREIDPHQDAAKADLDDMLYPFVNDYDQTLTYKIGLDYGKTSETAKLNADDILQVIRRIDHLTRGIPKIVYLVGWQYTGHDTGYPSLLAVNPVLKRRDDSTALASLRWLMREAVPFHTRVSLHVNFSDCYLDDNPLGPIYQTRDILVRETDGRHREGYVWNGHMAYRASNYRNWYQRTFRTEQIDPLFEMIPELKISGSLHPDAWYNTDDPYYQVNNHEDVLAMREMTVYVRQKYNVDLTTEFDLGRPENEDFVLYHPMIWHLGWNEKSPYEPMKVPSYFMTGGDAYFWGSDNLSESGKFFGFSATLESEINENSSIIPGGLKTFATRTLPWYFLNRLLRDKFDGDTAWFSNGVTTTYPGKTVIRQNGEFLQDGNDVFIPALWKTHPEIIAYSETGYQSRIWKLPDTWGNVGKIDLFTITLDGLSLKSQNISVLPGRNVKLSLKADEGVAIVPSGTDPDKELKRDQSGEVTFTGMDEQTKGNWPDTYGSEGYYIPGSGEKIPDQLKIKFINSETHIWENETQDIQAIDNPLGKANIAATRSHPLHEIIEFNFEDGNEHEVALYFLDWDRKSRWSVVDIIDLNTRKVLHSYNLTDYAQGIYLKYKMKGNLQCRLTNVWTRRYTKSPDVGISGIFLDPVRL